MLALLLTHISTAPNGMTRGPFCALVTINHGCCPACGYQWVGGQCKKVVDPEVSVLRSLQKGVVQPTNASSVAMAYCKSLDEPHQRGCCSYCGHSWSVSSAECVPSTGRLTDVPLATFDGQNGTTHSWMTVNDPVMGGASVSSFFVTHRKIGNWSGEVKVVPFLGQPGFCTVRTVGDSHNLPDATGTTSLALTVNGGSGLPTTAFNLEIGVAGVTTAQTSYHASLTSEYCCGNDCRVPWSAFALSFRGQPVKGPPLEQHLDRMTHLGLGTAGTAGKFEVDLVSLVATNNATVKC